MARKSEWNNPNKKAAQRAEARSEAFDKMMATLSSEREKEGYHRPGSRNLKNQR